jgi:sec-independent protein translocase protein TatC
MSDSDTKQLPEPGASGEGQTPPVPSKVPPRTKPKSEKKNKVLPKKENPDARMTFTEHLGELRTRIMRSGYALIAGFVICFAFSKTIYNILRQPLEAAEVVVPGPNGEEIVKSVTWVTMTPMEPFFVYLKLATYGGLLFALPVILYQICRFVFPGLKKNEQKLVMFVLFGCTILGILGLCMAYFLVYPFVVPFLLKYTPENVDNLFRLADTLNIVIKGLFAFALAFQFPMVVLALVYLELLTPQALKQYRGMALVGLCIASAILTPADPISMIMMAVPLYLMYELCIWSSYIMLWRRKKAEEAA